VSEQYQQPSSGRAPHARPVLAKGCGHGRQRSGRYHARGSERTGEQDKTPGYSHRPQRELGAQHSQRTHGGGDALAATETQLHREQVAKQHRDHREHWSRRHRGDALGKPHGQGALPHVAQERHREPDPPK